MAIPTPPPGWSPEAFEAAEANRRRVEAGHERVGADKPPDVVPENEADEADEPDAFASMLREPAALAKWTYTVSVTVEANEPAIAAQREQRDHSGTAFVAILNAFKPMIDAYVARSAPPGGTRNASAPLPFKVVPPPDGGGAPPPTDYTDVDFDQVRESTGNAYFAALFGILCRVLEKTRIERDVPGVIDRFVKAFGVDLLDPALANYVVAHAGVATILTVRGVYHGAARRGTKAWLTSRGLDALWLPDGDGDGGGDGGAP